jgi:hypothetical protein
MSQTTGGPVNGKANESDTTGARLPPTPHPRRSPVSRVEDPTPTPGETIDPWDLYKYYSPAQGQFRADAPIAEASRRVGDVLGNLRAAGKEENELERENHVAIAVGKLYGLAALTGEYPGFDDALSAVLTGVDAHRVAVYSRREIVALERVLESLRRSPNPSGEELSSIYDTLTAAGFDLNAPLGGADIAALDDQEL